MDMSEPEGVKDQHNPSVLHIRKKKRERDKSLEGFPGSHSRQAVVRGSGLGLELSCHDAIPPG